MKFPKCAGEFEKVDFRGVEIDRCEVGKQMDEITNVPCPSYNATLLTLQDKEEDHVTFEVCPKCNGVFLDAGEFRDLKDFSFLEQLKAPVRQFLEGK